MRTLHALLTASLVASCGARPVPRKASEEDGARRLHPRPLLDILSPAARSRSRTHAMSAKRPSRKRVASLERRVYYFGERPNPGDHDVPMLKNAKYEPRVLYFKLTAFESAPGIYEGKERELEEDNFMKAADHNLHAHNLHFGEEEDIDDPAWCVWGGRLCMCVRPSAHPPVRLSIYVCAFSAKMGMR